MTAENGCLERPPALLPAHEQPHCVQRQDDLYAEMDEMGRYAGDALAPARAHLAEEVA